MALHISADGPKLKEVIITILGEIRYVLYCSQKFYDDDFWDNYFQAFGFESVKEIHVDGADEDIVKKKGKYIKTKEYFHHLFREDGDHPLPVEVRTGVDYNQVELQYKIEVFGEFDPKKLQLIKSDYEFDGMPYFILADKIVYDDEEYPLMEESYEFLDEFIDIDPDDEWVVEKLYD